MTRYSCECLVEDGVIYKGQCHRRCSSPSDVQACINGCPGGMHGSQNLLKYHYNDANGDNYADDIHLEEADGLLKVPKQAAEVKLKRKSIRQVICEDLCHKRFQSASDVQTCIDGCASE
jgi:hypothetical protein